MHIFVLYFRQNIKNIWRIRNSSKWDDFDRDFSYSSGTEINIIGIYEESSEAQIETTKESVNNFASGSVSQTNGSEIPKCQKHTLILPKDLWSKSML